MDMIGNREKCIKQSVQIAKKNVMFLLSPEETALFTARNVIPNEKIADVKRKSIGESDGRCFNSILLL